MKADFELTNIYRTKKPSGKNLSNIGFLMTLYENGACFASDPGRVVEDLKDIRPCLSPSSSQQ
jgi:hypothetical protein